MALDQAELEQLLQKKDSVDQVLDFFSGATEADRKPLAKFCLKWLRDQLKQQMDAWMSGRGENGFVQSAKYAAHATCGYSELGKLGWRGTIDGERAYRLLNDRQPAWIGEWAENSCRMGAQVNWPIIRRLIREGKCPTPTHDNYIRLMIDYIERQPKMIDFLIEDKALCENEIWRIFEVPGIIQNESKLGYMDAPWVNAFAKLVERKVLDRQRVLESCFSATRMGFNRAQVKVFFEIHDALKLTTEERFAARESYAGLLDSELPPVVTFAFEQLQTLDKQRPLDEPWLAQTLQAAIRQPAKSMVTTTTKWLGQLVIRRPEVALETAQRALAGMFHPDPGVQEAIWKFVRPLALQTPALADEVRELAASAAPTVRKQILADLAAAPVVDNSKPIEATSKTKKAVAQKTVAKKATAKSAPTKSLQVDSPAKDELQEAVAEAKKVTRKLADLLALPTLLKQVTSKAIGTIDIPPCTFDGTELKRLIHQSPIEPIHSFEELVEVAAAVIEDGTRVDDGERVLEALSRFDLSDHDPSLFSALLKRVEKLARKAEAAFVGLGFQQDLPAILYAWLSTPDKAAKLQQQIDEMIAEREKHDMRPAGFAGFLAKRNLAILHRICQQRSFALFALPTHTGGWIDPLGLVDRIARFDPRKSVIDYDQVLSLLRLAPENRIAASKKLMHRGTDYNRAVCYALGEKVAKIGESAPLWVAAARARAPYTDDPRIEKKFPKLGPDAGLAARYQVGSWRRKSGGYTFEETTWYAADSPQPPKHKSHEVIKHVDYLLPTTLAHAHDIPIDLNFTRDTKPIEQSVTLAAATVWPLAMEAYFRVGCEPILYLQPMFDPSLPLREVSTYALVASLGSSYAPERTLAVDVAIVAIEDGRFDPARSGRQVVLRFEHVRRYAETFATIAATSPLHAWQIASTMIHSLATKPKNIPTTIVAYLELLRQLLSELETGIVDEEARQFLQTIKGSGKAAKLAKQLLDLEPSAEFPRTAILAQALRSRLSDRAVI